MSAEETPDKTGEKTTPGGFQKGADPRRGHGLKGRSGRPPNEFRESIRKLLDSPKVKAAVKKVLSNADHPQFASLYGKLVAQAHGNPATPVEHSGPEGGDISIKVTHEVVDPGSS